MAAEQALKEIKRLFKRLYDVHIDKIGQMEQAIRDAIQAAGETADTQTIQTLAAALQALGESIKYIEEKPTHNLGDLRNAIWNIYAAGIITGTILATTTQNPKPQPQPDIT